MKRKMCLNLLALLVVYIVLVVVARAKVGPAKVHEHRYEVKKAHSAAHLRAGAEYAKGLGGMPIRRSVPEPPLPSPFWYGIAGAQWPVLGALALGVAALWLSDREA